jgi:hypothetical protein
MAVSSLSRMTVPLASDQSSSNQGLLMPKLKYRFRVIFENFGVSTPRTELTKQVMDFKRPVVNFDPIVIPIYNSELKLSGKPHWADVTCTLRDDASGQVQRLVGEQVQKQMDFLEMASAASGIDYKFLTKLQVLDGGMGAGQENVLEQWELYGCYLSSVDYSDNNYGSNDPLTVGLTIVYDNANQVNAAGVGLGIGQFVGRTVNDVVTGAGTAQAAQ